MRHDFSSDARIQVFLVLFAFWMLLSHELELFNIVGGIASSLIVAAISHDLLATPVRGRSLRRAWRFVFYYVPWLLLEVLKAGIDVAYRVLHPRMQISPRIVRFEAPFEDDLPRTVLANSITLTPGTITIDVEGRVFTVHSLTEENAEELQKERSMQERVARIFREV